MFGLDVYAVLAGFCGLWWLLLIVSVNSVVLFCFCVCAFCSLVCEFLFAVVT